MVKASSAMESFVPMCCWFAISMNSCSESFDEIHVSFSLEIGVSRCRSASFLFFKYELVFLRSFQYYMLHRFLCDSDAPEVVIRQIGQSLMEVWDFKQGEVMEYEGSSLRLLRCFDPKKSFYLYEPEKSREEPHFGGLSIPTVCSVSPDDKRYKQFLKDGAVMLFMPTWALKELQAVRDYFHLRNPEQMLLSKEDISERFKTFGGIFRHVFAPNTVVIKREQERAVQKLDPKDILLDEMNQERREISPYVLQYRVITEENQPFQEAHVDFVSDAVREVVENIFF